MAELTAQPEAKLPSAALLRIEAEKLRPEFVTLAQQWRRDTVHFSRVSQKVAHPAYRRIMAMGESAIPLLLESLHDRPAHWFAALTAAARLDPVPARSNAATARERWLEWGRKEGLVD